MSIDKEFVVKYFQQGDQVKVIDGRYIGETAIVVKVNEHEDVSLPMIRLDSTNRELHLNTSHLQILDEQEKDDLKTVKSRASNPRKPNPYDNQKDIEIIYRVGELIMFDHDKKMT